MTPPTSVSATTCLPCSLAVTTPSCTLTRRRRCTRFLYGHARTASRPRRSPRESSNEPTCCSAPTGLGPDCLQAQLPQQTNLLRQSIESPRPEVELLAQLFL